MDPELRQELLNYLNGPGFKRLWPMVKKKMERLDRVGGRFTLSGLSPVERQAIEGLLAVNLHGLDGCTVDLRRLNEALLRSRFETTLDQCMYLLFPGEFVSRREERESEQAQWTGFCLWAKSLLTNPALCLWIDALSTQSGKGVGYRTFHECYDEFREIGNSPAWRRAVLAFNLLRDGGISLPLQLPIRLPIFAALATGDPHGLDRQSLSGRMFFWGLMALLSQPTEVEAGAGAANEDETVDAADVDEAVGANREDGTALSDASILESSDGETVRTVYRSFGILLDDISSFVFVARLPGVAQDPTALPLLTVDELKISQNPGAVFVVENPSIFGTLAERAEEAVGKGTRGPEARGVNQACPTCSPPLICTSGQPSIAALHLLDKLATAGAEIYYSGDFDVAGVKMAVALADRYGEGFVPWRWQASDYLGVDHQDLPKLSDTDLTRLGQMTLPWETDVFPHKSLLQAMSARGVKVFQEHLIEHLKADYASPGLLGDLRTGRM